MMLGKTLLIIPMLIFSVTIKVSCNSTDYIPFSLLAYTEMIIWYTRDPCVDIMYYVYIYIYPCVDNIYKRSYNVNVCDNKLDDNIVPYLYYSVV